MVQGQTNRQIAEAMFIELTTVKVHVHNILKKTGKTSRNEVISDFWHSMQPDISWWDLHRLSFNRVTGILLFSYLLGDSVEKT